MRIFKKLLATVLLFCIMTEFVGAFGVSAEGNIDISQPSVSGIYFDGTPMVGETITLHYKTNNPDNSLDELASKIKWFVQNSKYYVRNDTSEPYANNDLQVKNLLQEGGLTYTIPNNPDLIGKYISVWIPMDSVKDNGRTRPMGFGPIAVNKTEDMIKSSVTVISGNDNGTGADEDDILEGKFIEPDGDYVLQWYSSDTETGEYVEMEGKTEKTILLTNNLRGKYVKFGVVPVKDGVKGEPYLSDNAALVGNAAFGAFVSGNVGTQGCYHGCALNSLTNGISLHTSGAIFTYGDATKSLNHFVVVDMGKEVPINSVKVFASSVLDDYFTLDASSSGADGSWERMIPKTPLAGTDNGISLNNGIETVAELSKVYTTRYIRIYFTHTKNMYFTEFSALSKEDKAPVITLEGDKKIQLLKGQPYEEPGYKAFDEEEGDLTSAVVVSGDVKVDEIGEYVICYSVTDNALKPHTVTETRTVIVADGIKKEGDLAFGKTVTVSSGTTNTALTDGNIYTVWTPGVGAAEAIIDFNQVEYISKVEISETGNKIQSFKILASEDGNEYEEVFVSENGIGNFVFDIETVKARYLKLVVNSSDADAAISEFCCYFDELGKVKYAANNIKIDANLNNVTEDLPLPDSGEFDSKISWTSSEPTIINNDGALNKTAVDKTVTLTAVVTLNGYTVKKEFQASVPKNFYYIPSVNVGGGGGGGSSGSNSVYIPSVTPEGSKPAAMPEVKENIKNDFIDVSESHWAYEYIKALKDDGLVSGFEDGSFAPEKELTRAEFLKMVIDSMGFESDEKEIAFNDVCPEDWYYKHIKIGVSLGIINGMGEGSFAPNLPINRQDMAVIAAKALEIAGLLPEFETVSTFTDNAEISGYAVEAVGRMKKSGIINGDTSGTFRPKSGAVRAEAAKIVYHLHKLKGGE